MTNESYAEYLSVSVRTVANWRGNPDVIPRRRYKTFSTPRLSAPLIGLRLSSLC